MADPLISVQIPVKDPGPLFGETLDSLRAQELDGQPWELVIVDDGSSISIADSFDMRMPSGVKVVLLSTGGPGNRPRARNAAWRASRAPVSLMMDADLGFGPHLLAGHLETRERTGADAVMGARINAWSPDSSPWQRWFDTRAMGHDPPGPFPWKYFITGNLSLGTELLRRSGGFDEEIDRYGGEDIELGLRLSKAGARFHWEPGLRVRHLDRVTVREHSRKMVEYGGSGLSYTLRKHPEAEGLLGSSWVLGPVTPRNLVMRVVASAALLGPVYRTVLRWMERFGRPRFLFTYLSVGACLLGLTGRDFR